MKNNKYLVLLLTVLCFTVLPSFTILVEDITIPETEINSELETFVMELRVELVNYTEEINKLVEKEKILSRLFIVNPSSMVRVYNEFGCNGQLLGTMPFTSLNDPSMIASICGENGEGSYKYIEGAQNCIDMTCHSRPGEEH